MEHEHPLDSPTILSISGGVGSWLAARRWIDKYGTDNTVALFADTLIEDQDLYRFLDDIQDDLGLTITTIADGRTPWEVFRDVRMIGNTRADPCSLWLKRKPLHRWVKDHTTGPVSLVVGIDFTEEHRLPAIIRNWAKAGHTVHAPMCWRPEAHKADAIAALKAAGIEPPRLYGLGFPHNNCGGFCIKAGQAQFLKLLRTFPDLYAHHEAEELATRVHIGRDDIAILRDRRGGKTKPYTLKAFREQAEADPAAIDGTDWGSACSCFAPQLPFSD